MDYQPRIRYAELDYKARSGELLSKLTAAGHNPKVTIVLVGAPAAVTYRMRLSCTRCGQRRRRWPMRLWSGLRPSRRCQGYTTYPYDLAARDDAPGPSPQR